MTLMKYADELRVFFKSLPEVKDCTLYGSLSRRDFDEYSDIDIAIDVSGSDNGALLLKIPDLLAEKYSVIFSDYAPSLAPEKYIVSVAMDSEHPFPVLDVTCTATPHHASISKEELSRKNNRYDHTLKLFTANLKHHLRGADCLKDIRKMYVRIFGEAGPIDDEKLMLQQVYTWLIKNAEKRHTLFVTALGEYL